MPRANATVVHRKWATSMRALGGVLDDRSVTIQEQTGGRDAYGEPADTWTDVAGLQDLAAAVGSDPGREARRSGDTISTATHSIVLAGHYPEISTANRAVVDDTEIHDIVSVEHSVSQRLTRLGTRIVS